MAPGRRGSMARGLPPSLCPPQLCLTPDRDGTTYVSQDRAHGRQAPRPRYPWRDADVDFFEFAERCGEICDNRGRQGRNGGCAADDENVVRLGGRVEGADVLNKLAAVRQVQVVNSKMYAGLGQFPITRLKRAHGIYQDRRVEFLQDGRAQGATVDGERADPRSEFFVCFRQAASGGNDR